MSLKDWATTVIFCVALGVLLFLVAGVGLSKSDDEPGHRRQQIQSCREDDSCWDCTTMGNHKCGFVP